MATLRESLSTSDPFLLVARGRQYPLRERTHIMGILNVTPDSFSDGGKYFNADDALRHALLLVAEGADFIDVGGESSRPGADALSMNEELDRVIPVIERLYREVAVPISIDTYKATVADEALRAGASIVNDISALTADPEMPSVIGRHHAPVVLMHMRGTPKTMQHDPTYGDVTQEVKEYLRGRIETARMAGAACTVIDPGIGFGKTAQQNLRLIRELRSFEELGQPILVGPSRKSFIGTLLGLPPEQRVEGTAAAVAVSIMNGAHIVRVHDVREMKRVAQVSDALARG